MESILIYFYSFSTGYNFFLSYNINFSLKILKRAKNYEPYLITDH